MNAAVLIANAEREARDSAARIVLPTERLQGQALADARSAFAAQMLVGMLKNALEGACAELDAYTPDKGSIAVYCDGVEWEVSDIDGEPRISVCKPCDLTEHLSDSTFSAVLEAARDPERLAA